MHAGAGCGLVDWWTGAGVVRGGFDMRAYYYYDSVKLGQNSKGTSCTVVNSNKLFFCHAKTFLYNYEVSIQIIIHYFFNSKK